MLFIKLVVLPAILGAFIFLAGTTVSYGALQQMFTEDTEYSWCDDKTLCYNPDRLK